MSDTSPSIVPARLASLDALRGFVMFWITGGREIVMGLVWLGWGSIPMWVSYELEHPDWTGFTAWDMIMPLFLFVTGVAMPFSLSKRAENAPNFGKVYAKIARRIALLWILGAIAQGNLLQSIVHLDFSHLRLYSNTLQAIAAGYLIASIALLHMTKRGQGILCAALLLSYWILMAFVPYPGHAQGTLEPNENMAKFIDKFILGRFSDGWHYTWILSSLGFGGTVLLGVFGGHLLKSERTQQQKLNALLIAGVACLAGGWAWGLYFPIIKQIWTSSMALWAAGWSYIALAFFYWLADMRQIRKPLFPFVVIGCNAIVAYMSGELIVASGFGARMLETNGISHAVATLLAPSAFFFVMCAVLYVMFRNRIFVRL